MMSGDGVKILDEVKKQEDDKSIVEKQEGVEKQDDNKQDIDNDDEEEEDKDESSSSTNSKNNPVPIEFGIGTDPDTINQESLTSAIMSILLTCSSSLSSLKVDKMDDWTPLQWTTLSQEMSLKPISLTRAGYYVFLNRFPTNGSMWKIYAQAELRDQNIEAVQAILAKSLMEIGCPNVELWTFYLNFIKMIKFDPVASFNSTAPEYKRARSIITEAYELAIQRLGVSIESTDIWLGYIRFLQTDKDRQAFMPVRKIFHKAIIIPMHNMDIMWKEYETFEKALPNNDALVRVL